MNAAFCVVMVVVGVSANVVNIVVLSRALGKICLLEMPG